MPTGPTLTEISQVLTTQFDAEEINVLAYDLNIDPADLTGQTHPTRTRALVTKAKNHGQLEELLSAIREQRPKAFTVTRKRGAQPGNLNALKHGFYARHFRPEENLDLDVAIAPDLLNEVALLRVIMRRLFGLTDETQDFEQMITLLGTMGMAATRLAGLLKSQRFLDGQQPEVAAAFFEAMDSVLKELTSE